MTMNSATTGMLCLFLFCTPTRAEEAGLPMRSLSPAVLLPDGSEFMIWESKDPLTFGKTYYVDQHSPVANDENPGTEEKPFATIGKAAAVLQPGERVVIKEGIYRETVFPARGGTAPDRMISYEAAPGARVAIRGSRVFRGPWEPAPEAGDKVWKASLDKEDFHGYNPFLISNVTIFKDWMEQHRGKAPFTLSRGMVFQDGRSLKQVADLGALRSGEGMFWVDRPHNAIYVHPSGHAAPGTSLYELTDRETLFAPPFQPCSRCGQPHPQAGLGFIRVKGLVFEHAAGPWPLYQLGAISTGAGHHWIIEDNTIRYANGIGVDLGTMHGHQPDEVRQTVGHHIVRRNQVTDCGICGIAGLGAHDSRDFGLLIEDNVLLRNCYHDVESTLQESAAIKTHVNQRCLIRRNLIADTLGGPGIWMDWRNGFSRCTQNVILRTNSYHGAIFCELSMDPTLFDRNIVWDSTGNGFYEHDTRGNIFAQNFVGKSAESAFCLFGKKTERQLQDREHLVAGAHIVVNNLEAANGKPDSFSGAPSRIEGNAGGSVTAALAENPLSLKLSTSSPLPQDPPAPMVRADFYDQPFPPGPVAPGPFGPLGAEPKKFPLAAPR
ncbi:MAG: hypothetical protein BGO12_17310 [Verrucomicrobia bacterium 61-8]|nr:MAG: hypothetical protein BGO12_17310 [Verrucomicrobia bacterium 61-8]